jgi:PleD family two-component response regulator
MNKVIESNFLPREPDGEFSWSDSAPTSRVNEKRRILIVDNDTSATHLVRILLEKTGQYLVLEENNSTKAHRSAGFFGLT